MSAAALVNPATGNTRLAVGAARRGRRGQERRAATLARVGSVDPQTGYVYVHVPGLAADGERLTSSLWLKETFARRGVGLHICDLVPEGGGAESTAGVTLSSVVEQIQSYVDGLRDAGDNRCVARG